MLDQVIKNLFQRVQHVGSTATCNPAPTDTDEDWLCFCEDLDEIKYKLGDLGWKNEETKYAKLPDFISFRKRDKNLIVTSEKWFYNNFILASLVAKKLNLLKKEDRLDLFHAIIYNKSPYGEKSKKYFLDTFLKKSPMFEDDDGPPY